MIKMKNSLNLKCSERCYKQTYIHSNGLPYPEFFFGGWAVGGGGLSNWFVSSVDANTGHSAAASVQTEENKPNPH
jgi:hypothetical protein